MVSSVVLGTTYSSNACAWTKTVILVVRIFKNRFSLLLDIADEMHKTAATPYTTRESQNGVSI